MSGRIFWGLWIGALAVLSGLGSCNASSLEAEKSEPAALAAKAQALASPPASALPAGSFALTGELTQGGWALGQVPRGTIALSFNGAPQRLAGDGRFLLVFDRDAASAGLLTARLADGRELRQPVTISPRAWNIEHVAVGPRPGALPSAEYQRRRSAELARINAARAVDAASDGWRQRFIWPVTGRISGRFGSQRIYRGQPGAYHSGMDIATGSSGTPFVAPADGVVILAAQSPFMLEGRLLMIDHGMGLNSAFLHCSALLVKEGDVVRQGQLIGHIGMTGRATGPHLHWSIKRGSARLDPLLFAGPMPVAAAIPRAAS